MLYTNLPLMLTFNHMFKIDTTDTVNLNYEY